MTNSSSCNEWAEFLLESGITKSKAEGRRLWEQGAIHLYQNAKGEPLKPGDPMEPGDTFRIGKRRWFEIGGCRNAKNAAK